MAYTGDQKRAYDLAWRSARRQAWIDEQGGACANCGGIEELEIDHIDPELKTMQPREVWSRRQEIRDAELENCQVLCSKCHLAKTSSEQAKEYAHGTYEQYNRRDCRCTPCTESVAPFWRAKRAKKKDNNPL